MAEKKYKAMEFIDADKDGDPDMAVVKKSSAKGGFIPETPEEAEMLSQASGNSGEFKAETPEEAKLMSAANGGDGEFKAETPEEEAMLKLAAGKRGWRDVSDEEIQALVDNLPEFDGDLNNEDDVSNYILSNYDFATPDGPDVPEEEWDEFYTDGSPFNKYEKLVHGKLNGKKDVDSTGTVADTDADDDEAEAAVLDKSIVNDESMKNIISALSDRRF